LGRRSGRQLDSGKAESINVDHNKGYCLDLNAERIHQCPSFEHFIPITGERSTTWLGFGWLMKKLDA
jgi:hypothetical protein